jgi:hypothetical protein
MMQSWDLNHAYREESFSTWMLRSVKSERRTFRNESQRRGRKQSREEAKEKAGTYGDATDWKLYDKTTSYARMAASKCPLEEN